MLQQFTFSQRLSDKICRVVYAYGKNVVLTTYGHTEWFKILSGFRQGCILLSLLFIVYMGIITKKEIPGAGLRKSSYARRIRAWHMKTKKRFNHIIIANFNDVFEKYKHEVEHEQDWAHEDQ